MQVSVSLDVNAVIAVCVVVISSEVGEVESIWHCNVISTLRAIGSEVVTRCTVVSRRRSSAGTHDIGFNTVNHWIQASVEGFPSTVSTVRSNTVVVGVRVCSVEVRSTRAVTNCLSMRSCLVHESDSCCVVRVLTSIVVVVFNLIRDVVEDGLECTTEVVVGVLHVSPFNNEHLVWVSNTECFSAGCQTVNG